MRWTFSVTVMRGFLREKKENQKVPVDRILVVRVQKEWRNQLLNVGSVDLVTEEESDQPTLPPPQLFPVKVRGLVVNWQQPQFCFRQPGFMSNESTANR